MEVLETPMGRFISILFCNITKGPQELQRFDCACGFIDKSAVITYHQPLSKVISIKGKSRFDQLATASSSTPP